jgi:eukaryotic-like serine/threonine-protein kinase
MSPHGQRVDEIVAAAAGLSTTDRAAYLDRVCAGDQDLRHEVESRLSHATFSEPHLESPVAALEDASTETVSANTPARVQIGAYLIVRQIGSGGMGLVYEAIRQDQFQ